VAPTVLLLDAASFTDEGGATFTDEGGATSAGKDDPPAGSDRVAALSGLLADLGVPSHRIAKGMPFQPVVEHERSGPPELKVLPGFGRVIAVDR
jgi:hypothetical protein